MSEIPKTYEPPAIEAKWYAFWEQNGCFAADHASPKPAYSIVIPPPNVTGSLTLGHVLNNTIQDILARRARMTGHEVLWLPGTDHAGIATQNVVEKTLRKEGVMKHRDDLGREALVGKIWEWKEKYGGIILKQLRALGASCDWSRTRFTMDEDYSHCVQSVFVDLYKKGLIYRGKRMVNWCPASLTALSDEEVIMKEQKGFMYHFRVEVAEEPGTFLTIATTRPETIPADTAVAVNPNDPRYTHLIGKHVYRALPLEVPKEQRRIPIIADDHVTFDFGTGVLKVTPAHDKADYEIGVRHKLPVIDLLTPDGRMTAEAGADLAGLDRFAARKKAHEILEAAGALEKAEPYVNNVGFSERADVPIEPRLSEQWFLKYPSVAESQACVADGRMKFFPDRWAKVYDHWLNGIQDWCISRQLWWGHRVPVWKKTIRGTHDDINKLCVMLVLHRPGQTTEHDIDKTAYRINGQLFDDPAPMPFLDESESNQILDFDMEVSTSDPVCETNLRDEGFTQDSDVLDTWFSSWLWPFATMGWPEKTDTLAKFYPTTDLVTGPDIIFFWVARMIMAGFEWMGELPFRNVYFTSIIRDKQGRKLSKSLGNSPDPLDLIAKFGADALRFGTMRSAPLGLDVTFDEKNIELGRNFCTKLWNAARFRQMQGGETEADIVPTLLTSDDKWILLRLDTAIAEVSSALAEYRFADAANALYRFFWSEYCDWYVEASKASLNVAADVNPRADQTSGDASPPSHDVGYERKANTLAVMDYVFSHTLRLFHPFMPFITEELWQGMGFAKDMPAKQGGQTIMFAPWPKPFTPEEREYFILDESDEQFANAKYEVVNLGRGLRRDFNIASSKRVRFVLKPTATLADHETAVLQLLLNAEPLEVNAAFSPTKGTPVALTPLGELFLPLDGLIDVAAERERIGKEIAKADDELAKVRTKLADPNFAGKVPAKVLEDHQTRERDWAEKHAQLTKMREALGAS
ncbi:MAG: valine--tRNA ligase [Verrucomicrobia bacterium]|nr:valine--tRNA ligase [Verrucomicrobiota bacterium]